jgi:hypothetical protein
MEKKHLFKKLKLVSEINGRGSTINSLLDGSTYPGYKLVPSPLCKKSLVSFMKSNN